MSDETSRFYQILNFRTVLCPKCGRTMPFLRLPRSLRQLLFGGWTCRSCGCRMNRWGEKV
jgi:transposase